jgi:hypothetical protein
MYDKHKRHKWSSLRVTTEKIIKDGNGSIYSYNFGVQLVLAVTFSFVPLILGEPYIKNVSASPYTCSSNDFSKYENSDYGFEITILRVGIK